MAEFTSPTDSAFLGSPERDAAFGGTKDRRRLVKATSDVLSEKWMANQRDNIQAYEYLCHIGEAKEWIEAMLKRHIPPTEELEEELRNGIVFAHLAKSFEPTAVKKIFEDRTKLQFRHSDNINYLLQAMRKVNLPDIFYFELTDLYDKKNIPKVIYCIHALSHLLSSKGRAPHIKNLVGQLQFDDDVLDKTQLGLDESGVVMPAFGNIEKALKKELSAEEKRDEQLDANEENIKAAQAIARKFLARKHAESAKKKEIADALAAKENAERLVRERADFLLANEGVVVNLQAIRRGKVQLQKYTKRLQYLKQNAQSAIMIQSLWKGYKAKQAYIALSSFSNPSVMVMKAFLHLLDDSSHDYEEEIELEVTRQKVVKAIRENMQTETDVSELDNKIALLVKNRISLEEVATMTSKKMRAKIGVVVDESANSNAFNNLKGHDKDTKLKIKQYQNLFYMLQTEPMYIAKLMYQLNKAVAVNGAKPLEGNVMALFGYAQNTREEYLLLQLIVKSIKIELSNITHLSDFWRSNPFFIKLVLQYSRGAKERLYIRELLQPLVKEILEAPLDLECDPLQIYKGLIRKEETTTGQKSSRNPEATLQIASEDPEVIAIQLEPLINSVQKFMVAITASVKDMPFGMRYIAMELKECMKESFKGQEDDVIRSIGNLIYYRYMNPAIVSPEIFDVIEVTVNPVQRKNLSDVSKILHRIAVSKPFSDEDLRPLALNQFIVSSAKTFGAFLREASEVPAAEDYFGVYEYNDASRERKPVIYISAVEIYDFHRHLSENIASVASDANDNIHKILNDLGAVPSISGKEQQSNGNEIALTLTNKYPHTDSEDEKQLKALIRQTKRHIFTIIQVQDGKNLLDILEAPVTQKEEARYVDVRASENMRALSRSSIGQVAESKEELSQIAPAGINGSSLESLVTFAQFKATALVDMDRLEELKFVTKQNNYQEILNNIAKDMLSKHLRRRQRTKELVSLAKTGESLDAKAAFMDSQKASYNDYVAACLAQLGAKKGKSKSPALFSKQYFHLKGLQKSGKMPQFGSFKYTGEKLHRKGVLVSVEDCNPKQYDKINFTIASDEPGVFALEGAFFNVKVETQELRLEDLLQYQYEDVSVIPLFGGAVRVNVNLMVYLINKK